MSNILEVDAIEKRFGQTTALSGISLAVREGEFLTLLGPSGCGKTTLIRIIAGFESPNAGDIRIDGKSILASPPYRRPVGMVFQNLALFPHLNVAENIGYGLKVRGAAKDDITKSVKASLEMIGLPEFGARRVDQLSGGQRQRVALARAIVTQPRVLLLDEPLGALDLKIRRQMQSELKLIQEKSGTTFIFVTHDQDEALTMSDRIAVFKQGSIEQIGTPEEIYAAPQTRFVAQFVGDTNFLTGSIERDNKGHLVFNSPGICMPFDHQCDQSMLNKQVSVSLRPEHIRQAAQGSEIAMGTVERRVYAGPTLRVWLKVGEQQLIADWPSAGPGVHAANVGDTCGIFWESRHAVPVPTSIKAVQA